MALSVTVCLEITRTHIKEQGMMAQIYKSSVDGEKWDLGLTG